MSDDHNQVDPPKRKYAMGGLIKGDGGLVRLERVGIGPDGMCLYSINGGRPERIYAADDVRKMGRGEVPS